MKISFLIIGLILFLLGIFTSKLFLAAGLIFIITSFFGKRSKEKRKELPEQKIMIKAKNKCSHCGAELLHGDNYCPECGQKILP